ncbi:MAG: glutamate-5-semialdehyde dehydrogenase [Firmicutes bacterium]|nr:glutamate-5-semialdehyde dehydrogenase [Bacillota bacterium]MBR2594678.1 glutamate-5-semialdehyde dehydrogenase [Bacillota bacterium]
MKTLAEMGQNAQNASVVLSDLSSSEKNAILNKCADALIEKMDDVLAENKKDVDEAVKNGLKDSLIDRLSLSPARIEDMAKGLRDVAALPDPVGEIISGRTLYNGLILYQKRVPMGVIGIIYEARPNVTADAFGLCLKSGNATILRGGKEAINSNKITVNIFRNTLKEMGYPEDFVQIIENTDRETAKELMRLKEYIDVLIPRGGAGLIKTVVENSTVPVIETGVGNCHIYVDEFANLENAVKIVINAKTQRPGVCNAAESMLIHEKVAEEFVPMVVKALREKDVEIRGDEKFRSIDSDAVPASEEDWGTEFLDFIISAKIVKNVDEAIEHIRKYGTKHSEAIISEDYTNVQKFLTKVDAAAVYANASTRFTDGGEFGLGAEIGISTQKLHARGPMGLKELTTTKNIIYGNGQIR